MTVHTYAFPKLDRVVHGPGAIERVPVLADELGKRRVYVVTNNSLATRTPIVTGLEAALGERWAGTFPRLRAHVPADDVDAAAQEARQAGADLLVGLGGSSVTDATKIVALRLGGDGGRSPAIPQIAVPTTLSAGEYTPASGMTGEVDGVKSYVADPSMIPWAVVLDPVITLHTPTELWASTGVKVLDHACEAVWGPRAHPYAATLALEALRRIIRWLPRTLEDPSDLEARAECQLAGWMSMAGVVNVGVHLSHTLGHQIGARWHVPHGVTSCITLAPVMRFVARENPAGVEQVAEALGAHDAPAGADAIEKFVAGLPVPTRLRDVGAAENDFPAVAEATMVALSFWGYEPPGGVAALVDLLRAMW